MKLNDYVKKYGNVEVDEAEMNEVLGIETNAYWKPKIDDIYWEINTCGKIVDLVWNNDLFDLDCHELGNCYKNKEEAEFALSKQKFLTWYKRELLRNEIEPVNWKDTDQPKYYIFYSFYGEILGVEAS